jgi:hypothetical protein
VLLQRLSSGERDRQYITLARGSTVRVTERAEWSDADGLGSKEAALVAKGGRLEGLVLTERVWSWSGLLDLGYRTAIGPEYGFVTMHNGSVGLRVDHGWLCLRVSYAYGRQSGDYQAWGYELERNDLRLEVGPAFDLGDFRLSVAVVGSLFTRDVSYRDGTQRPRGGFGVGMSAALLYPVIRDPLDIYIGLRAGLGAERAAPVTPVDSPVEWSLVPWVGLGLAVGIF